MSFQGMIRMPMTPVINPPVLKLIRAGARFAKSLAGPTILAAILVASVDRATASMAKLTSSLLSNLPASTTGSQMVVPNMMVVADVTTTPIKAKRVIEGGSPIACPLICAFWLTAYRVKSGIFSDRVAQKPTMPVRPGIKNAQNDLTEVQRDGRARTAFNPPLTWVIAQYNSASAASGTKNALNPSSFRMLPTPSQTTHILI